MSAGGAINTAGPAVRAALQGDALNQMAHMLEMMSRVEREQTAMRRYLRSMVLPGANIFPYI